MTPLDLPPEAYTIAMSRPALYCLLMVWIAITIAAAELQSRQFQADEDKRERKARAIRRQLCPEQEEVTQCQN